MIVLSIRNKISFLIVVLGLLGSSVSYSESFNWESLQQWSGLTGSVRTSYWSGSRDLDDRDALVANSLWLRANPELGSKATLVIDGWVGNSAIARESKSEQIREFFLESSFGNFDFRLGRQLLVWGRADKLNPTDNLTPRDFTLLTPDDTDQRIGALMAKGTYFFSDLAFTAVWLPEFKPSVIPLRRSSGVSFDDQTNDSRDTWALKLEQVGDNIDWSISYLDGYNIYTDLGIESLTANGLVLSLQHPEVQVIGMDVASTIGEYGVRAELAYTRTEDNKGQNPFISNSFYYLVAGGDRTFNDYLNINLQLFVRHIEDYADPSDISDPITRQVAIRHSLTSNQVDRNTYGVTLRISNLWLDETLETEFSGAYSWPRNDYLVRAKLSYSINDQLRFILGADIFRGDPESFYGNLRDNSVGFGELQWSF